MTTTKGRSKWIFDKKRYMEKKLFKYPNLANGINVVNDMKIEVHRIHIHNRYDPNPILFHRLSTSLLDLYRLFFTFRLRSSPFTGDQLTASSIFCCSAPSRLHHRSSVALLLLNFTESRFAIIGSTFIKIHRLTASDVEVVFRKIEFQITHRDFYAFDLVIADHRASRDISRDP
ncbi:hypothetical protein LXL04_017097 [Taraxacum kok-saghyz]